MPEHPRDADDQEFEFMAESRRNLLVGMWAAELLGLIGQAAHDQARHLMQGLRRGAHDEEYVGRLARALEGRASAKEIRDKMAHLLAEARRQLRTEKKGDEKGKKGD